jgi:hypothetical protein
VLRPSASIAALVLARILLVPVAARAGVPERLTVASASGACPSAEDVTEELKLLLPDTALRPSDDLAQADVTVVDRGSSFSVNVRGQRRRFRDTTRDCLERARHVAVFAVLIIDPLRVPRHDVDDAEEEPAETPQKPGIVAVSPAQPAPAPSLPSRSNGFDLSLGPLAQVAAKSDAARSAQARGLGLRLRYGGAIGGTLGIAGLLPTSLHFRDAEARATWLPFDLGLSLSELVSNWELSLDVSLAAALLLVKGQALDATQQATRLELGGRAGVGLRYWATRRAGVFGGLSGSWFPKPYELQVEGLGAVGHTPTVWIGGSLGAVIRL